MRRKTKNRTEILITCRVEGSAREKKKKKKKEKEEKKSKSTNCDSFRDS